MSHPIAVNILSDDDDDEPERVNDVVSTPSELLSKRRRTDLDSNPTTVFVIDDDPTPPPKPPISTSVLVQPRPELPGMSGLICLESDNECDNNSGTETGIAKQNGIHLATSEVEIISDFSSRLNERTSSLGNTYMTQLSGDSSLDPFCSEYGISQAPDLSDEEMDEIQPKADVFRLTSKSKEANKKNNVDESKARQRTTKEERLRLMEEKRLRKEQEKLQKAALKAEALEMKKLQKEKKQWEKGKLALKSIVAEIDTKVIELGSVGGHLLTRFADKCMKYRITSNPIERSIVWSMPVPEDNSLFSSSGIEIPYVLLVYEADEFCDLVNNELLVDHVSRVQNRYPNHTVCYLTNKLMSYINKREQGQYKDPTKYSGWKRPPVEEVLSKLTSHFSKVHSRHCTDEAELAEHVVGLTSSLASCQFRQKLTRLSVNANGSLVPKDCVDKNLIKKNLWLKALVAIPKVQPRFAIAIWKKYPTMKSLLSVYMDPSKSVHEKEFLLKDLTTEVLLGENRRLGEVCSKRVYRILMAQCGDVKADDVEDGAGFFHSQSP